MKKLKEKFEVWMRERRDNVESHIDPIVIFLIFILASQVSPLIWSPAISLLGKLISLSCLALSFVCAALMSMREEGEPQ